MFFISDELFLTKNVSLPKCPFCNQNEYVDILDTGIKRYFRKISSNNRYYCLSCTATWRKSDPTMYDFLNERRLFYYEGNIIKKSV